MRDLPLWRALQSHHFDVDELLPELDQLAKVDITNRYPFVGFMNKLLDHADHRLRAAAVRVLSGVNGHLGLRQIVKTLGDPEPTVRLAALAALQESAYFNADLWFFALFHADVNIRRTALESPRSVPAYFLPYLLPDPAIRDVVLSKLTELTAANVPLVIEMFERGQVDAPVLRPLLRTVLWSHQYLHLAPWCKCSTADDEAIVHAIQHDDISSLASLANRREPIDGLFEIMASQPDPPTSEWLMQITQSVSNPHEECAIVAACTLSAWRTGAWRNEDESSSLMDAVVLACWFRPMILANRSIPMAVRRRVLRSIYRHGTNTRKVTDEQLQQLLASDVCQRADGTLELWAVGGVLHFAESQPYRKLIQWQGIAPILAAFESAPEESIPFLSLFDNDTSAYGRRYLIRELCLQPRAARARFLALLARVLPSDGLDFLDALDGRSACDVFIQLETIQHPHLRAMQEKKAQRCAAWLAPKILGGHLSTFLREWLELPGYEHSLLGQAILGQLARKADKQTFLAAVRGLDPVVQPRFLIAVNCCPGFPYDRERELAESLVHHPEPEVRAWSTARRMGPAKRHKPQPTHRGLCLRTGLCDQLAAEPTGPNADYCLSLLASHDPIDAVVKLFARFSSADEAFRTLIDESMIEYWRGEMRLPLLGHMVLYRWEQHLDVLLNAHPDWQSVVARLQQAESWPTSFLAERAWEMVWRILDIWQFRKLPQYSADWPAGLIDWLTDRLTHTNGKQAARLLMRWRGLKPDRARLDAIADRVRAALPTTSVAVQEMLRAWVPLPVPEPPSVEPAIDAFDAPTATNEAWAWIRTSHDVDALIEAVKDRSSRLSALRRLETLGERTLLGVIDLLADPEHRAFAEKYVLHRSPAWTDPTNWERLTMHLLQQPVMIRTLNQIMLQSWTLIPPAQRIELLNRLESRYLIESIPAEDLDASVRILQTYRRPIPVGELMECILRVAERENLPDPLANWLCEELDDSFAANVARSRCKDAYLHVPGVQALLKYDPSTVGLIVALERFLDFGDDRDKEIRRDVAVFLYEQTHSPALIPILLPLASRDTETVLYPELFVRATATMLKRLAESTVMVWVEETNESHFLQRLQQRGIYPYNRDDALTVLLQFSRFDGIRTSCRDLLKREFARSRKLRAVADTFSWGVRIGRQLTGKMFGIEMIPGGEALGYTRFTENKVYINPLPILRRDLHGKEVVRALIVHEFGHHMYHRGAEAEAVWKSAQDEGLHPLLNLVSDEHLERNLRALDQEYGDDLKTLAAYAFQRSARDLSMTELLSVLRSYALEVLQQIEMEPGKEEGSARVGHGQLLAMMEKVGMSFARFVRALRMGLGNRHHDPKVEEGLTLFRGRFRHSTMPRLKEIAIRLREIFGQETSLLDAFGQDHLMIADGDELDQHGDGISNLEIQREVQSSLEGKRSNRPSDRGRGGRGLNLGPEEHFDEIEQVKPMPYDPAAHARYVEQVARSASRMRRFFDGLGLSLDKQRFRLSGKSFDRTRAKAVVLKGDPRMLIARQLQQFTDLFLGIVIDCSGSMSHQDRIERAKLFGTLLAEAAKGQRGVDVRLFGFTDQVIYDAGRAERCAVHALEAGGGNNDAAGLWYAAQVARASRRKAKLLVMISDGSPTECTVASLRALVKRLTHRWKMCCAQVAVCPLEHQCFDNYILLDIDNVAESVRQFGNVMVRLVQKALRGG